MSVLGQAGIFLGAAVVAVPLFRKAGFGSVLGYLAAGVLIGPWGLGLVSDVQNILHFSEIGVVFLLFVIGLELQPSRLWVLRRAVFGLGTAQVLVTGALLALAALATGMPWEAALIAGLGLSLSSTAFVLQMLAERRQLTTAHGRASFAILLFQDLAVIPLLALMPLLAGGAAVPRGAGILWAAAGIVAAVVALVAGGRYLLRPVFRLVAAHGSHEIFTASALLVVIGSAMLMEAVGVSMALGAFLAGVLLADSEYRHALEADIEPFKGLLLGLFFIAVGMSTDVGLVAERPFAVAALVLGLLALKGVVLALVGRLAGKSGSAARNLAFTLPQGGEFAFVLFSAAVGQHILARDVADTLILVVTLSMALTPLLFLFNESVLRPRFERTVAREYDRIDEQDSRVIIAGFGRVGQIVGRILLAAQIPFTALESSSFQVDFVRRFGSRVYYGDASRPDVLRAAGAERAALFVLAIDDMELSLKTAAAVRRHFPRLKILARARNRHHAHLLMDQGVRVIIRETLFSSLELADHVLRGLGMGERKARETIATFRRHDERTLLTQHGIHHDERKLIQSSREAARELQELLESEAEPGRSTGGGAPRHAATD